MKHIILAAGRGTRMGELNAPKCLLPFNGKTLLEHQMSKEVVVVKGYKQEMINAKGYVNEDWANTNMVESLMVAREEFDEDLIVSYGDIFYNKQVLSGLLRKRGRYQITVDTNWKYYWNLRYGTLEKDTESLKIRDGLIEEIGRPNAPSEEITARYVGLMKFQREGLSKISEIYDEDPKWKKAYMTDMIQELINRGEPVEAYCIKNQWIEFDTSEDYEKGLKWIKDGTLKKLGIILR